MGDRSRTMLFCAMTTAVRFFFRDIFFFHTKLRNIALINHNNYILTNNNYNINNNNYLSNHNNYNITNNNYIYANNKLKLNNNNYLSTNNNCISNSM